MAFLLGGGSWDAIPDPDAPLEKMFWFEKDTWFYIVDFQTNGETTGT